jgi:class 3 adenylate cyclase
MFSLLCYVVLYYNVDNALKNIYLPWTMGLFTKTDTFELISTNHELYFLLKTTSYFMILLYSYTLSNQIFIRKFNDRNSLCLIFIYIKHIIDIVTTPKMTIMEYELSRCVMWAFTTPLMLKMLCDTNNLSLQNINIHYHIITIFPHIFIIPFKNHMIYLVSMVLFSAPFCLFVKTLGKYNHLPFVNMHILVWLIFMLINCFDIIKLCKPIYIHAFYNLADTLCKFICTIVISNYNEQETFIRENMDLQSVNFVSGLIKFIKEYEKDNQKLSVFCVNFINNYKKQLINKIPLSNHSLKIDLLKKLLPFDFDKDYLDANTNKNTYTTINSNTNKKFDFICVLFMDIVNYTELAKKYDGDTIFRLLNNIYDHFDNIIKKYSHLQKIETIGDAYMVVGDIFRNELNHKVVVKEMILLALEFIKEIKTIKTPHEMPLSIRIGINIGSVNVGILGNEVPRLCVVGNTVNVAARLQSTAETDSIQISRHVYEHTQDIDFDFIINYAIKENVFLKNIGSIITYTISPCNLKLK